MKTSIGILLYSIVLVAPVFSAERYPPEYSRREVLIRNAVDTAPLPDTREIATEFGRDEDGTYFLQVHWRTGSKRGLSPEEMETFRRICFAITRKLIDRLPNELSVTRESEIKVTQSKSEYPRDGTIVRRGMIPLHFKKDA
jgi:hypothetical protein